MDEPILPITADDVVSMGEFMDVEYFEPSQALRDPLFVGELINTPLRISFFPNRFFYKSLFILNLLLSIVIRIGQLIKSARYLLKPILYGLFNTYWVLRLNMELAPWRANWRLSLIDF